MKWNTKAGISLALAGSLVMGALVVSKTRSQPAVAVTLRIAVTPADQSDFVTAQANSARFKYLVGRQSGVRPVLAQKLSVRTVPNTSLVEAQVRVLTREEARRYVDVFVPTLQEQCGGRARLALAGQTIR